MPNDHEIDLQLLGWHSQHDRAERLAYLGELSAELDMLGNDTVAAFVRAFVRRLSTNDLPGDDWQYMYISTTLFANEALERAALALHKGAGRLRTGHSTIAYHSH